MFLGFLSISTSGHGHGRGGFGQPLSVIDGNRLDWLRQGMRLLSRIDHIYDFLYDVCMHSWLSARGAVLRSRGLQSTCLGARFTLAQSSRSYLRVLYDGCMLF